MGPLAAEAVDALIELVENRDKDQYLRALAAEALGNIGPDASSAIPRLVRPSRRVTSS